MKVFVISTGTPLQTAEAFRLTLALEKGHSSTLTKKGDTVIVESDGKQVQFVSNRRAS